MGHKSLQAQSGVWSLAERQHGVVTRRQLIDLGFSSDSIAHRTGTGRLHRLWAGVYAVGSPRLTQHGHWIAAVLACGHGAALSHESAAALWKMRPGNDRATHVSVPAARAPCRQGLVIHRRATLSV